MLDLKVGDEFVVRGKFNRRYVDTVERLTKTLIVSKRGDRYKKDGGYAYTSDVWDTSRITSDDPQKLKAEIRNKNMTNKIIDAIKENGLTDEQITEIFSILNSKKELT